MAIDGWSAILGGAVVKAIDIVIGRLERRNAKGSEVYETALRELYSQIQITRNCAQSWKMQCLLNSVKMGPEQSREAAVKHVEEPLLGILKKINEHSHALLPSRKTNDESSFLELGPAYVDLCHAEDATSGEAAAAKIQAICERLLSDIASELDPSFMARIKAALRRKPRQERLPSKPFGQIERK